MNSLMNKSARSKVAQLAATSADDIPPFNKSARRNSRSRSDLQVSAVNIIVGNCVQRPDVGPSRRTFSKSSARQTPRRRQERTSGKWRTKNSGHDGRPYRARTSVTRKRASNLTLPSPAGEISAPDAPMERSGAIHIAGQSNRSGFTLRARARPETRLRGCTTTGQFKGRAWRWRTRQDSNLWPLPSEGNALSS